MTLEPDLIVRLVGQSQQEYVTLERYEQMVERKDAYRQAWKELLEDEQRRDPLFGPTSGLGPLKPSWPAPPADERRCVCGGSLGTFPWHASYCLRQRP